MCLFFCVSGTEEMRRGLRDQSKRDSSTARRGSFAGANEEEKAAPLRSE